MGNCLPKFKLKRNKVHPGPTAGSIKKKKETNVSEILSRSSASVSIRSLNSTEEENSSLESLIFKKDDNIMDELKEEQIPVIKKPIFFQVDFVQGMRKMPSRLAERIDQKQVEQISSHMVLNDEDELMMNEIMEEVENKQKLERLREQMTAAQSLKELHLQSVRDKARGMASRPQTRAGRYGNGVCGGGQG